MPGSLQPGPIKPLALPRPAVVAVALLLVANVAFLAAAWRQGLWPTDGEGRATFLDFLNVWSAGQFVRDGHAAAPYDYALHKAQQEAILGRPLKDFFPWFYPPHFLGIAALLSLLPAYGTAFLAWLAATFVAYLAAIHAILRDRLALLLAAAFPAVVTNAMVGQNGFLTAALLGGALHQLERRPVAAGVLFGLLTCKPHLGLLIPLALACGGYWRAIAAAAATTAAIGIASLAWLGSEPWEAFIHALPLARDILARDVSNWSKLHSVYAVVRVQGGSEMLGWALQGLMTACAAMAVAMIWRGRAPFAVKAAALAVGALLATPYLFIYDFVVLAVPIAFLIRLGAREGFLRGEAAGLAIAGAGLGLFPIASLPFGLVSTLLIAALVVRRVGATMRPGAARAGPHGPESAGQSAQVLAAQRPSPI